MKVRRVREGAFGEGSRERWPVCHRHPQGGELSRSGKKGLTTDAFTVRVSTARGERGGGGGGGWLNHRRDAIGRRRTNGTHSNTRGGRAPEDREGQREETAGARRPCCARGTRRGGPRAFLLGTCSVKECCCWWVEEQDKALAPQGRNMKNQLAGERGDGPHRIKIVSPKVEVATRGRAEID